MMVSRRGRGLGTVTDAACAVAKQKVDSMSSWEKGWWNPYYQYLNSIVVNCKFIPDVYSAVQYGITPTPKPSVNLAPVAPKTGQEMLDWTPADAGIDLTAYSDEQRAAIQAAIDRGEYNPYGNFSLFNLFSLGNPNDEKAAVWDKYKWWIIGGSAAIVLWLAAKGTSAGYRVYRGTY